MSVATVDHRYRYPYRSAMEDQDGRPRLRLATSGGSEEHPYFFTGWVGHAASQARALLLVARTARTRYHAPPAMLQRQIAVTDPVITADRRALRFEAFSADCGVYARHDVDSDVIDGALVAEGTTNVDLNPPMREALAHVVSGESLHLAVGAEGVDALTSHGGVTERRVPLPMRWVKAFGEIQVVLAGMEQRLELSGPAMRQLVRDLPRSGEHQTVFHVRPSGTRARLSRTPARDAVALAGAARLLLIEPLLIDAQRIRGYAHADGSSGWVLDLPGGRATIALSPEVWRGFSGEGATLRKGSTESPATHSRAGYDLASAAFFPRTLPFEVAAAKDRHPRLRDARALVDRGAVRMVGDGEAFVAGRDAEYHVRGERCTCPWFARHGGERGPCKHVLATELAVVERGA